MNLFSKNLKYLRKKYKLSQNKLAEMSDVNQTTIARWENGEISPSLDNIYDVANALNVSVANIAGKDLEKEQQNLYDYELDLLFDKHKDILTYDDKEKIKAVIEKRQRDIDRELDGE